MCQAVLIFASHHPLICLPSQQNRQPECTYLITLFRNEREGGLLELPMNTVTPKERADENKRLLSLLWIFVMFNMVFADIVGLLNPGTLEEMIAMRPPQYLLLVFSVLIEIPIAMIVLSRYLPRPSNRVANIVAAVVTVLWVIGGGTLSASYIFFAAMEVGSMVFIIRIAWAWKASVTPGNTSLDV